jgi:hypothetical protein
MNRQHFFYLFIDNQFIVDMYNGRRYVELSMVDNYQQIIDQQLFLFAPVSWLLEITAVVDNLA